MSELVHLDVAGGVATITLDSPRNRNALSRALRAELATRIDAALDDPHVRVVVLTHTGSVFCAGADLKEVAGAGADEEVAGFPVILEKLWTSPKPIVARLAGPARAGGLGLVAACDIAARIPLPHQVPSGAEPTGPARRPAPGPGRDGAPYLTRTSIRALPFSRSRPGEAGRSRASRRA